MFEILNKINSPKDLKNLSFDELEALANDVRLACLTRVSEVGGHVGSNLGVAELMIALHYVFDFETDKLVLDVSHQCYPHKILTGRKNGFINKDEMKSVTGYLAPSESEYDIFQIGHTSTSISLATGLAKARDLNHETHNVVTLIGDGSLSGGEAFEGLNNAGTLGTNFIVVVNDNDMSIAENQGSLYVNLRELKNTRGVCSGNFFKTLGFDYVFVQDGNDVKSLVEALSKVKDISHPIIVHVSTLKGNGYEKAVQSKEEWHFKGPFDIESGELKKSASAFNYNKLTHDYFMKKAETDDDVVLVTAATPSLCGFTQDLREKYADRFVDVAIAEEHAVAFVSGLAKAEKKPVFGVNSSFIQRTYDQLSQELALNSLPAVVLVYSGGISGANATHLGLFDIALTKSIPNLICLSPTSPEEYLSMLEWAINQTEKPVIIRVPNEPIKTEPSIEVQAERYLPVQSKVVNHGENVCVIGLGNFLTLAKEVVSDLKENHNINATLVNAIYSNLLDKNLLAELAKSHKIFVTLEDGVLAGGFGESVASELAKYGVVVLNFGADKEFTDNVSIAELKNRYGLTAKNIVSKIIENLN